MSVREPEASEPDYSDEGWLYGHGWCRMEDANDHAYVWWWHPEHRGAKHTLAEALELAPARPA